MPIPTLAEEPDGTLVQCPPQDPCQSFLGRRQLPLLISNPIAHPQTSTWLERPLWKPQGLPAPIYPTLPLNPTRRPSRPMTSLRNKKSQEELENARASKSKICLRPKLQLQSLSKKLKQKETKNNMWAHTPHSERFLVTIWKLYIGIVGVLFFWRWPKPGHCVHFVLQPHTSITHTSCIHCFTKHLYFQWLYIYWIFLVQHNFGFCLFFN